MYERHYINNEFNKIFYHLLSYLNNKPNINGINDTVTYLVQIFKPKQANGRDIGDFERLEQNLQIKQIALSTDINKVIDSQNQNCLYNLFKRFYKQSKVEIISKLKEYEKMLKKLNKDRKTLQQQKKN